MKRGMANSRMKDYYDLLVLREDESLDRDMAAKALMRTFARRDTKIPIEVPEGLSDSFAEDFSSRSSGLHFCARTAFLLAQEPCWMSCENFGRSSLN